MKRIATIVMLLLLTAPCGLILHGINKDSLTLWNLIGLAWILMLVVFGRKILNSLPKWAKIEIKEMVRDDD